MRALGIACGIVTAVLSLALVSAGGAARGGAEVKGAILKLDTETGGALPTRNGVSLVNVDCYAAKGSRCQGSIRLLPRGAKTRGLVGSAPIASASTTLASPATKTLRLQLSRRASAAISGNSRTWLDVTIEVKSNGKRATHAAVVDDFRPVLGHKTPSSIRALRLLAPGRPARP
jgi:hypothetical protein